MNEEQKEKCYPVVINDKHPIFTFVERVKDEVVICVGNQLICEKVFKTEEQAIGYVNGIDWQLLTNLICIVAEKIYDQKKLIDEMKALNGPRKIKKS